MGGTPMPTSACPYACFFYFHVLPDRKPVDSFIAAHRDRLLLKWTCAIYDDYRNTGK